MLWPTNSRVRPYISSKFGKRKSPGGIGTTDHKGIDIPLSLGRALVAVADGTVIYRGYRGGWGNHVQVRHNGFIATYSHLKSSTVVKVGQKVREGQRVGDVGMTGNTTGPHVHFEIIVAGVYVDPDAFLSARVSSGQLSNPTGPKPGGPSIPAPEPEKEAPTMQYLKDTSGRHFIFDERGAVNIGTLAPKGVTAQQLIKVTTDRHGEPVQVKPAEMDLAVSMARKRAEQNLAAEVRAFAGAVPKPTVTVNPVNEESIVRKVSAAVASAVAGAVTTAVQGLTFRATK